MPSLSTIVARAALALAASSLAACGGSNGGNYIAAPQSAYVRAVHGSPNAGNVDVYVYAQGTSRPVSPALANVPYKAISSYAMLSAGTYTIDVLAAGSPSSTKAVASENVTLTANEHASVVVGGEAGSTLQFFNFVEPAETAGVSALVVHHASPFVGSAINPVGVGVYDASAVSGVPTPAQTTQLFTFAVGAQQVISPVPVSSLPATLGLAAGAPGTASLASVAVSAPLSAVISGVSGFPATAHVSLFAIDASASSATLIGDVDP
jgi:hypothetical protein